jgi:hypothetical protein
MPEPTLWAAVAVSVGDADVLNIPVALRPGMKLTGRVVFEGTRAAPPADQVQRLAVTLHNAEGRVSAPIATPGRARPDGVFETAGFPAGRYYVNVATPPAGWTMKTVMFEGRDIASEPFELSDADLSGAVVTLTDRPARLSGTVVVPSGADASAEVIVVPADSNAWRTSGVHARRSRSVRASATGGFVIDDLPPGDYFVAAVPADAVREWQDPEFLEPLVRGAMRVTMSEGQQQSVTVRRAEVKPR